MTAASTAVAPEIASPPKVEQTVANANLLLAAASSPLNIPINFAIDLMNIPKYEVDALNYEAAAFFFTGSWWVSNATNVWGTDPGDPPKYIGAAQLLLPNPWLSAPLGATLSAIATVELPVNATCGTTLCPPYVPFNTVGAIVAALGLAPLPIINNFFTVPLSDLYKGYYYDPTAPGQLSFGGYVPTNPFGDEYDLPGTIDGPNGTYLMPWAGQTVNLTDVTNDAWAAYIEHLQADPSENPIQLPTGQDVARALTNLAASFVVAFDPFTAGMSYCPKCNWPKAITPEGIVGALSDADPGNTLLKAWLDNHGWQASQGAPGSDPTPSTPESSAPQPQSRQAALNAALEVPAADQPTGRPSVWSRLQDRQAKSETNPAAAPKFTPKSRLSKTTGADTGQATVKTPSPAGATRTFADRINDAVSKAIGGGKSDTDKPAANRKTRAGKSGQKSGSDGE